MWAKISLVLSLLPKIIAVVKLVDEIMDPETPGAEKKEYALDIFREVGIPENVIPMVGEVLDVVVAVLHFFGLLSRKKDVEAVPAVDPVKLSKQAQAARAMEDADVADVAVTDEVFNQFLRDTE